MKMNKKERELRFEIIRKAQTSEPVIKAVVELVDAELADNDINDDDAHERVHEAVRDLVEALGYGDEAAR